MASKQKRRNNVTKKIAQSDLMHSRLIEVRNSPIHGRGVYAVRPIKRGTRVCEYLGERISHAEADRRFARKRDDDGHTFLFVVNNRTVIDGTYHGNDARFINHNCDTNCETVTDRNRIFIEATRDIKAGEELGYDYQLTWSESDTPEDLALYNCRCGSKKCRGTMLDVLSVEQHRALERAQRQRASVRAGAKAVSPKKKAVRKAAKKTTRRGRK